MWLWCVLRLSCVAAIIVFHVQFGLLASMKSIAKSEMCIAMQRCKGDVAHATENSIDLSYVIIMSFESFVCFDRVAHPQSSSPST